METKALIERFAALTDEQKERAKACKTPEELTAPLVESAMELSDGMLDDVAGGEMAGFAPRTLHIGVHRSQYILCSCGKPIYPNKKHTCAKPTGTR